MLVCFLARQDREQKRQIGIVGIEQIKPAQVQRVVTRDGGKVGVELVIGFQEQVAICIAEDTAEFAHGMIELRPILAVDHNGEREVAQVLPFAKLTQAVAQVVDVILFRVIPQNVARINLRLVVPDLRDEAGLGDIEVAAAFPDLLACRRGRERDSVATQKLAWILSSRSRTSGRVSLIASFMVRIRTM